ncbi:NEO1 [Mytilus coruscus]|uniref:NEO1 n=1 Tax=Mytilus coruscus TaxID=42192 RepID=A0A6J8BKD4_MYTCO|nr:NEO1 [Mytilus coruscus]
MLQDVQRILDSDLNSIKSHFQFGNIYKTVNNSETVTLYILEHSEVPTSIGSLSEIMKMNLTTYKNIILQVGGNDISAGKSLKELEEDFESLIWAAFAVEISWSNTSEAQNWPLKWTQHIIHYKTDDNNTIHQKSVWKNSTIIYKLENDKMYYFRIETVFPGKSIFSAWEKFSTYLTEKTPPPPPKDMYLSVVANNSMVIKWLPPPQEYRVRVRQYQILVAEEDGRKQFFRVDEQIRKFLVHNLDRSKDYTVEIAAINNIGESDKIVRFLEAFRNISNGIYISAKPLSSTSVQVSWTTSYNSDLTRYLLRYNTIKSAASQPVDSFVKPSVMSHVMNNLQQHTEYIISLIPYFNDMPGNLTMTTVWTFSDVPSAPPKDVTVLSVNNSNFMVSWNPPPEHTRNGDLVYYRLEYRTKYDETSKTMLVPADKNEMLLSGKATI